jgi:two-component system, NarL family, nitrate/nitrite response regulator NarL
MAAVAVSTAPRVRVIARSAHSRARLLRAVEQAGIPVLGDERRVDPVDVVVATPDDVPALASVSLSTGVVVIGGDPSVVAASLPASSRAWGLVPDSVAPEALSAAIHAVAAGLRVMPSTATVLTRLAPEIDETSDGDPMFEEALTPREHEVLELAALGLSNHAIAARLAISDHTVKFHLASVYGKLGVRSRTAAVRRGLSRGLITI